MTKVTLEAARRMVRAGLDSVRDGEVIGAVGASGGAPEQDLVAAEAGAAALGNG